MNKAHTITYVLGGGFMKKAPDTGRAFYRTIIGVRKTANVLICCFALPRDRWELRFDDEKNQILKFNDGSTLAFQNADPDRFIEQVAWADVVVFRGGSTKNLIDRLTKVENWQTNLAGKTIVGSSAGACMLSSIYVVTDAVPQLAPGLGLLPVVIATHYRSTFIHGEDVNKSEVFWDKVDSLMETLANERDVVTLVEGAFLTLSRTD